MTAQPFDLLVIGGGITGAGIARDAAMRGFRTALVEAHDLGAGTSSHSSRLIHGGLRYLEQGDFRLVHEATRERRTLLRIAPHLVRPLAFVFPVHHGDRVPLWKLAAGMWLYDLLAAFRNVRRHRILGKRALLAAEPMLRERGLVGGARYYDAQCDDARLVLATARSAMQHGATIATYTRVTALERSGGQVRGAVVQDQSGREGVVQASVVVNATGAWTDQLRRLEDPDASPILRRTRGAHVMVRRERLGHTDAITLTSPIDGRVMFVLPWGAFSYIGTTDTDEPGPPEAVAPDDADLVYLLRSANACFPQAHLAEADIISSWAGVRALLGSDDPREASALSREHVIRRGPGRHVHHRRREADHLPLHGGGTGGCRGDRARPPRRPAPPRPRRRPTPNRCRAARRRTSRRFDRPRWSSASDCPSRRRTISSPHYGTEAAAVCNLARADRSLLARLHPDHPAIEAEVIHHARRELAAEVDDVLTRRIHLRYETADHGARAAPRVAALLGRELEWGETEVAGALARWAALSRPGARREAPGAAATPRPPGTPA